MFELEEAQAHLRTVVQKVKALRYELLGIAAELPVSPQELSADDVADELDPTAEIRAKIRNVVNDRISPAIDDLEDAAELRPAGDCRVPVNVEGDG